MVDDDGSEASRSEGKGWPDVLLALPIWLIALALISLVCLVAFSLFFSQDTVKLGFLGVWGRSPHVDQKQAVGDFPGGAVVAFAIECPAKDGWEPFKEGAGRFIIGAGSDHAPTFGTWGLKNADGSESRYNLSNYVFMTPGGQEKHKLIASELPRVYMSTSSFWYHVDNTPSPGLVSISGSSAPGSTSTLGSDQPFDEMPPYIPLNLCKKK